MNNKFTVACKVIHYDEIDNTDKTDYTFIPADTLEEAGAAIDDYYGNNVISVEMKFIDFPFVFTSYEHVYNDIMREMT